MTIDQLLERLAPNDVPIFRTYVERILRVVIEAGGTVTDVFPEAGCPEIHFTLHDGSRYHEVRRAIASIHEEIPRIQPPEKSRGASHQ
jgi:hypothetical protein